jgi:hypothetical protein
LAEWKSGLACQIELAELQGAGIDWALLGFDADDLAKLLDPGVQQGLTDPDEVPEPPDEAITQPGDIWVLGAHRLLCGDSSRPEDVDRLLDGQRIHLVNTDPPYNVKVEPRSNNAIAAGLSSFGEAGVTHHQGFDLARRPELSPGRAHKHRGGPKDSTLAKRLRPGCMMQIRSCWAGGLVGNIARVLRAGPGVINCGGYAICWQISQRLLKRLRVVFSQ